MRMISCKMAEDTLMLGSHQALNALILEALRALEFFTHGYLLMFSLGAKNLVQNVNRNFILNHEHRVVTASFITSKTNKKIT